MERSLKNPLSPLSKTSELYVICVFAIIGRVNEYPTMHYFGNPGHTQSMIAYMI